MKLSDPKLDRWDRLFQEHGAQIWPEIAWRFFKAVAYRESAMDPEAVSPCGAQGLMQLMPATDLEIDGDLDGVDPSGNIENGIQYLRRQNRLFRPTIPDQDERLKFTLGAYNAGPGYVLKAIKLYYAEEHGKPWCSNPTPGCWQRWEHASVALAYRECVIRGRRPDYMQVWHYVKRVWDTYQSLMGAAQ
jgi:membrane-bound lytic murein transglycosylase MltF